ncbi:hypothetical protein [Neisseria meningitidis serogroup B]|uniref:Uncharacterized protein n=1 Tax=Neisseria meningitidis serogroup B TaxID=491 RepID=A0A0H5E028_NEIMI|nr:hypothetical protein [Neisseria meningitidis serogroup B]
MYALNPLSLYFSESAYINFPFLISKSAEKDLALKRNRKEIIRIRNINFSIANNEK